MSQSRKITEPSLSWFLSWPKSPTLICWVCFGFHHLLPFILFWLGLIWAFETGFHSVQGVALNLQFSCFWRLCVGMTGVCCFAQPYFWLLIQEYECVPHSQRSVYQDPLKNNPLDSFHSGEEYSQSIPKHVRIHSVCHQTWGAQCSFEYEKWGASLWTFKSTGVSDIFKSPTQHLYCSLLRFFMRVTASVFALGRK